LVVAFREAAEQALNQVAALDPATGHAGAQAAQAAQVPDEPAQGATAHGALFLHAPGAAAQDAEFVGLGDKLHLHLGGDLLPVAGEQLLLVGFDLALGRAHEVMRAALTQQGEVVFTDDAAVEDPAAAGVAKLLFERVEKVRERGAVEVAEAARGLYGEGGELDGDGVGGEGDGAWWSVKRRS